MDQNTHSAVLCTGIPVLAHWNQWAWIGANLQRIALLSHENLERTTESRNDYTEECICWPSFPCCWANFKLNKWIISGKDFRLMSDAVHVQHDLSIMYIISHWVMWQLLYTRCSTKPYCTYAPDIIQYSAQISIGETTVQKGEIPPKSGCSNYIDTCRLTAFWLPHVAASLKLFSHVYNKAGMIIPVLFTNQINKAQAEHSRASKQTRLLLTGLNMIALQKSARG